MYKSFIALTCLFLISPMLYASDPPFSPIVPVDKMLYLSGQVGSKQPGAIVPGGIKAETKQALENVKHLLEQNGSSMDRIAKCTVMLTDMHEWAAMNEVYMTYFPNKHYPARSVFGTTGLVFGARVEIECIATVGA